MSKKSDRSIGSSLSASSTHSIEFRLRHHRDARFLRLRNHESFTSASKRHPDGIVMRFLPSTLWQTSTRESGCREGSGLVKAWIRVVSGWLIRSSPKRPDLTQHLFGPSM